MVLTVISGRLAKSAMLRCFYLNVLSVNNDWLSCVNITNQGFKRAWSVRIFFLITYLWNCCQTKKKHHVGLPQDPLLLSLVIQKFLLLSAYHELGH